MVYALEDAEMIQVLTGAKRDYDEANELDAAISAANEDFLDIEMDDTEGAIVPFFSTSRGEMVYPSGRQVRQRIEAPPPNGGIGTIGPEELPPVPAPMPEAPVGSFGPSAPPVRLYDFSLSGPSPRDGNIYIRFAEGTGGIKRLAYHGYIIEYSTLEQRDRGMEFARSAPRRKNSQLRSNGFF